MKLTFYQSVSQWESSLALGVLCCKPYEPTEESSLHSLSLRTGSLLFLTTVKWLADLYPFISPSNVRCFLWSDRLNLMLFSSLNLCCWVSLTLHSFEFVRYGFRMDSGHAVTEIVILYKYLLWKLPTLTMSPCHPLDNWSFIVVQWTFPSISKVLFPWIIQRPSS